MSMSEHMLVELKAKVDYLEPIRSKLKALKAKHVGTFQQTDIYFYVPRGRLKLRQINNEKAQLIYYERENISKPKRSSVFIIEIPESKAFHCITEENSQSEGNCENDKRNLLASKDADTLRYS